MMTIPTLRGLPRCGNCGHPAYRNEPWEPEGHEWQEIGGRLTAVCNTMQEPERPGGWPVCPCNEYEPATADSEFPLESEA